MPRRGGPTFPLRAALDRAGDPADARPLWEEALERAEVYNDADTGATARARLAQRP